MSGPLSKFVRKVSEPAGPCQFAGCGGAGCMLPNGHEGEHKFAFEKKVESAYTIHSSAPSKLEVKSYQLDRLNQEIEYHESLIRECTVEITALTRQKEKALLGLDKAEYSAILVHAEKIKKAREGRTKPPEVILELGEENDCDIV